MAGVVGMSERYRVLRQIGAGGMGIVYEAEDLERGQKIALKTIAYNDVEKIYRLKREFRALADLSHPNLVSLYELVVADTSCFFTMELLDGVDLLAYLHRQVAEAARSPVTGDAPTLDPGSGHSPCDFDRLRVVLPQLVRGLRALHAAGKIHRDVKPSNIRVTSDSRAVLLDFGLVADAGDLGVDGLVGTVPYLAPEQCSGHTAVTPAADWYGLGVVLYEALTGRLPFDGNAQQILFDKQTRTAPRARDMAGNVPRELDDLCAQLLAREPGDRLDGDQVMRLLGIVDSDANRRLTLTSRPREDSFAGRETELAGLDAAFAQVGPGRATIAVVRGASGIGKTALVERFLERVVAREGEPLVLRGRCLDREDVPYKAIDHLIDQLSDWWRARPPRQAAELLPRDAHLLPMLFPVLDRVPAIADAPRTRKVLDPQVLRTHAFDALRETLQRLADRHALVLFLDDMQWVDRDTSALIADLMRAPDPPGLLFVLATRADENQEVLELVKRMACEQTIIDVGPLDDKVATALALAQLSNANAETARQVVHEAEGSPLFLLELARYLRDHPVEQIAGKGLDVVLAERIESVGESAGVLAEIVAIAGEPITRRVLALVAELPSAELSRQLSQLRAERIVKMAGSRADDTIEPYHARIRTALVARISPERRAGYHRALAMALSGNGSAHQLAHHWYSAGDREHAATHARRAAAEARAKLDFDLSARFCAIALEGPQWNDAERRALQTELADALADAGKPREAADTFLIAADGADRATQLELRRRAAGSLLQSGYVVEGLELTRAVLAGVGLAMAKTPLRSLISMLARRAWLRIRGLGFRTRSRGELSQLELTRVDVCEGVAFGLALVNTFQSMDFATRFLHASLRLGEPWRVARALALETDFLAATAQERRATRLLDRLAALTATIGEQNAPSQLSTTRGFVDFFIHNRFRSALDRWTDAIANYRAQVGRAGFELDTVNMFCCWCLYYLGEIGELSRRVPAMAEAAVRNGNRYTAVTLRSAFPIAWLVRLSPDEVEAEIDAALASWSTPDHSYQLQHMFALCSRIELALFRNRPEDVTDRLHGEERRVRRALLDRPPTQAMILRSTFARHAIACAFTATTPERRRSALAAARTQVRIIRKIKMPVGPAVAAMFDGMIAELEQRRSDALIAYETALPGLERYDTLLYAHALRDRIGRLLGGDEGYAMRAATRAFFASQGITDPAPFLAMLLPG